MLIAATACATPPPTNPVPPPYDVENVTLTGLQHHLAEGRITSVGLVERYLMRIAALDTGGPALHSVIAVNPRARDEARRLDEERARGRLRGPLHGIPVAIKDNIEMAGPLPTTAGSLALAGNVTGRDATVVARLTAAGAIVLAKTNLSEWANFRSTTSTSGWSAVGGLTKNPYSLDRNPCGSSSGSGVAVAASFAAAAIGTETDGSVTCPAAINGLVGLKPTVGLVSRRYIVPISAAQDTAGPMTRTVADAAALLTVIAGSDADDPATREADARRVDYSAALTAAGDSGLRGTRLGILGFHMGYDAAVDRLLESQLTTLEAAGATIVRIGRLPALPQIEADELTVLLTDFRQELNAYLAGSPAPLPVRTLADLLRFNTANASREMPHFGQDLFERSEATAHHDPGAYGVLRTGVKRAAASGLDQLMTRHGVHALIAPTIGPAWLTNLDKGDAVSGSATTLPAVAGYPHLTVPMGFVEGLPVGLSFIGPAWSEATLLAMGYAFEQRTRARRPPALPATPAAAAAPAGSR